MDPHLENESFKIEIAVVAVVVVAYPLDLVRRKLQVQGFAGSFDKTSHYNGMIDAFKGEFILHSLHYITRHDRYLSFPSFCEFVHLK
jgi:hypothetical protein